MTLQPALRSNSRIPPLTSYAFSLANFQNNLQPKYKFVIHCVHAKFKHLLTFTRVTLGSIDGFHCRHVGVQNKINFISK